MAEYEEDIVITTIPGQVSFLERRDVRGDVAAQGIEPGFIQEHHFADLVSVRAHGKRKVQSVPLAGEQEDQSGQEGYEAHTFHTNAGTTGQS